MDIVEKCFGKKKAFRLSIFKNILWVCLFPRNFITFSETICFFYDVKKACITPDNSPLVFQEKWDKAGRGGGLSGVIPSDPQSAIRIPQSAFLNPQSSIRNPQSSILNPQSSILNPQCSILNPQSSILNPQSEGITPDNPPFFSKIGFFEAQSYWSITVIEVPRLFNAYPIN